MRIMQFLLSWKEERKEDVSDLVLVAMSGLTNFREAATAIKTARPLPPTPNIWQQDSNMNTNMKITRSGN